ncbi:MAG: DUF3078 domain-containing protein [Alloprevotella sp.]|nr:DUF3078 domain-containing protein [Alloprevotella sp.]
MDKKYITLTFSLLIAAVAWAQTVTEAAVADTVLTSIARQYSDSLVQLKARYGDSWHYEAADTMSNPYYFPLFASPTYYGSAAHNGFGTLGYHVGDGFRAGDASADMSAARFLPHLEGADRALLYIYTRAPWLVRHMDTDAQEGPDGGVEQEVKPQVKLSEQLGGADVPEAPAEETEVDIEVRRPNFWTFTGNFAFQLIQNYVTGNWYKGGESHHSMLATVVAEANYDNKQRVTFKNKLEMKLGFQSSHSDETHKYKTNSDLIRLTNEFGLKATKHWYYSAMLQSWTQFYRGYKKNDERIYSDFMSPFESLLTFGKKYSFETHNKRFKVDVNLSPLAAHLLYVGRPSLEEAFGLRDRHHSKFEYGSNVTATHMWKPMKNVTWTGRFY